MHERVVDIAGGKYPRVRGEEEHWLDVQARAGNTPACAGKSFGVLPPLGAPRKYPRVRGEESNDNIVYSLHPEIPPRARGRDKKEQ